MTTDPNRLFKGGTTQKFTPKPGHEQDILGALNPDLEAIDASSKKEASGRKPESIVISKQEMTKFNELLDKFRGLDDPLYHKLKIDLIEDIKAL
ncbi:MAG: hypothetical protein LBO09_09635 [Candidatus Peribacteria bacterium]|jgi:hypothetical protein|nr:hypothetical protein [Candidatus Peribacteria bacterium]